MIVVPYTTVMKRLSGQTTLSMILASASSAEAMPQAVASIEELLRQRHKIGRGADDDFTVRTQQDIASVMGSTSRVMRILLAAIASVSLLVGGIGIMNIMLVSVTERTREIGIRMAVGAKGWHILVQFLAEAVVLSAFGGLAGIGLGFATAKLVAQLRALADPGRRPTPCCSPSSSPRPWASSSASGRPARPRAWIPSRPCATSRPH